MTSYISRRIKLDFGQNLFSIFAGEEVWSDERRVRRDDVGRRDHVALVVGEGDVTSVVTVARLSAISSVPNFN